MISAHSTQSPNPSVKGTPTSGLRPLAVAPYVERWAYNIIVRKFKLKPCPLNAEREARIEREVLQGEAQDAEAKLLAWRHYIARASKFPFSAKLESRVLGTGGLFSVIGLAAAEPGEVQLFAKVIDGQSGTAVPLFELMPISPESPTIQAVLDWRYWVERGYAVEGWQ